MDDYIDEDWQEVISTYSSRGSGSLKHLTGEAQSSISAATAAGVDDQEHRDARAGQDLPDAVSACSQQSGVTGHVNDSTEEDMEEVSGPCRTRTRRRQST